MGQERLRKEKKIGSLIFMLQWFHGKKWQMKLEWACVLRLSINLASWPWPNILERQNSAPPPPLHCNHHTPVPGLFPTRRSKEEQGQSHKAYDTIVTIVTIVTKAYDTGLRMASNYTPTYKNILTPLLCNVTDHQSVHTAHSSCTQTRCNHTKCTLTHTHARTQKSHRRDVTTQSAHTHREVSQTRCNHTKCTITHTDTHNQSCHVRLVSFPFSSPDRATGKALLIPTKQDRFDDMIQAVFPSTGGARKVGVNSEQGFQTNCLP